MKMELVEDEHFISRRYITMTLPQPPSKIEQNEDIEHNKS